MKITKKYITLLTLFFLFSEAFAYRLKDEDVIVVGGVITSCIYDISTKGNVIEIPEVLDGQTITGIGDYAFSVAGKIADLILPSTLKTIGYGVFEGHALTSLVIPSGVTSIGARAFYGNALSSINLPTGLESIADETFANNQLTGITLPDGLKTIGYGAFQNNKITSLTIPNSVLTIREWAFANNRISVLNFQTGCQLKEISAYCFLSNDIKNLAVPGSVLIIDDSAFSSNINLNNVTFGTNFIKIGRGAFNSCNLASVNLPGSLVFIGRYAFEGNSNLNTIKLPVSAKNYQWNDSNGDKHNAGEIVTIKYYSYVAIIPYTLQDADVVVENGVIISCSYFDNPANVASIITIPSKLNGQNITGIGSGVFYNRGISEVVLPEGLVNIDNGAFSGNEIIQLTIPNSVVRIGESVFSDNCINTLTFKDVSQLEFIGRYAFQVNRLITIDFPKSIVKIEKYAFQSNFLQKISFEANSRLISIGSYAFTGNVLSNFTLPDPKVNSYDHWVDWDGNTYSNNLVVTNLESFYKIPIELTLTDNDVEVINGVIVSCTLSNLNANILTIPKTLDGQEIIGIAQGVFQRMGLIGVNLPSSLRTIEYGAFMENEIIEMKIPASVEEIKGQAFYQNNINELIFEENSKLRQLGWGTFYNNKISLLTLPDSLNQIDGFAFAYNKISNGVSIPDSIEYIGWGAFTSNQIPAVFFGKNSILSSLGEYAFANNMISNEIFIPKTLTEISDYAFSDNRISKIIIHDGIVEYGNGAFLNNNPSLKIVLHKPPTIPLVTHFFWWKDNNDNHFLPGDIILDFNNRYKAVIDQFFVVKFIVEDDNNEPVENASIQFYGSTLVTDLNGLDSIGPVFRGLQNYNVSASGCYGLAGNVDVQDNMTVLVTLVRYYNVNITVVDVNNNPIPGAGIVINGSTLTSGVNGKASINLPDGNYPLEVNAIGYKELDSSIIVMDFDNSIIIKLLHVMVNYLPNGGSGASYTETTAGIVYETNNNTFSRIAYTFSHWNSDADNSGINYSEKESISLGYTDIDLYAIWNPVEYKIIYHLDGGINAPGNPAVYNTESEINLLPASKPTLYFAAWLDADSNRVNKIEIGSIGDIELWAVFTAEPTYFIDYHNLENASHYNQSFYTKFDLPMAFTNADKRGYEFAGWYEDFLMTKKITSIPDGSKKNYDIYAKWGGAIEYAISYNLDGGINNLTNPVKYTIESNKIIFESPSKTGGAFVSWYSDKELTRKITEIPNGSSGDTTIYAKWELDIFDIQYVLNGGNNSPANPANYTIESNQINFESPSKTGAAFVAWYSDKELTKKISGIPTGSLGDTTIYAKWELNGFEIKYLLNGGINHTENPSFYTIESNQILFESPTKTGAVFIAWYSDKDLTKEITGIPQGSIGDTTIYAMWDLAVFNIDYVLNGGNNHSANPTKYTVESGSVIFESPAKTGATFAAWFSDKELTQKITGIPIGSIGDTTVYAMWELDIFDIHYVLNGGSNHLENPGNYTIESNSVLFKQPSKTGAVFIAWYSDKELTKEITGIPAGTLGDTTIFASWELDVFNIDYILNGGNNHPANPLNYTIESDTIILQQPDNPGFIFDGWFTKPDYSESISIIPRGSLGDLTVYAKWIELFKVNFTITTDGINPARDIDVVIGDTTTLITDLAGLADTLMPDGSSINYSVEINGIIIDDGFVTISGSNVNIKVEIVDCYLRWYDVLFCDNRKGLWSGFVWSNENIEISNDQFYHHPGGIEEGKYRLLIISAAGVEYLWEKELKEIKFWEQDDKSPKFEVTLYPVPITHHNKLHICLSEEINLQTCKIFIYSSNGTLIKTINNPLYMNEIYVDSKFSSGLYHVVLNDDKNKHRDVKVFIVN